MCEMTNCSTGRDTTVEVTHCDDANLVAAKSNLLSQASKTSHLEKEDAFLGFMDFPDEVLEAIACHLSCFPHVVAFSAVNKRIHALCKGAPLRIEKLVDVRETKYQNHFQNESYFEESRRLIRLSLSLLCQSYKRTVSLDLSCLSISDEDVLCVIEALPELSSLRLATCTKLTNSVVEKVLDMRILRVLDFRRCYGLDSYLALSLFNKLANGEGGLLEVVTLSHIDLLTIPLSLRFPLNSQITNKMKFLALLNCPKISRQSFQSIVSACPNLRMLCLGGSSLFFEFGEYSSSIIGIKERVENGLGIPRCGLAVQEGQLLVELDKMLCQTVDDATSSVSKAIGISSFKFWLQNIAIELALAAFRLPYLRILEISFCAQRLPNVLRELLTEECLALGRRVVLGESIINNSTVCTINLNSSSINMPKYRSKLHPFSVWNISDVETIQQMHYFQQFANYVFDIDQHDVDLILNAVCSGRWPYKSTALHQAAEEGNLYKVDSLILFGADPCAIDRSGTTPLFSACEAGHLDVAKRLLQAGAKALGRNAAYENSLYIAALRGHSGVVHALIEHCDLHDIDWTDPDHYGDGWTSIHAAAVSGRVGIAAQLVSAAKNRVRKMLQAKNRYGQTSLHVAARKGSPDLLRVLLQNADKSILNIVDADGRTAADVAKKNGNSGAWKVLTGVQNSNIFSVSIHQSDTLKDHVNVKHAPGFKIRNSSKRGTDLLQMRHFYVEGEEHNKGRTACLTSREEKRRWVGRRLQQRQQSAYLQC